MSSYKQGSALLFALLFIAASRIISTQLFFRSSLLIQTVYERELFAQRYRAHETLMRYAISVAKHNWRYITKRAQQGPLTFASFDWPIDEQKMAKGTVTFISRTDQQLAVTTQLEQEEQS